MNTDEHTNTLTIKAWAEEDRPREKMLLKGKNILTDAELVAILIGSGSREETAVALSQRILQSAENNLNDLGRYSIADFVKFKGIGEAKAISIVAALELGRRRQLSDVKERPKVTSSRDAHNAIAPILMDLTHEEFWVLMLNRANEITRKVCISRGGVAGTVVDAKIVFKKALESMACSIILCHNHPSGNTKPSQADVNITEKLVKAGKTLDINVLDHLIITDRGFYSFADEGMM